VAASVTVEKAVLVEMMISVYGTVTVEVEKITSAALVLMKRPGSA